MDIEQMRSRVAEIVAELEGIHTVPDTVPEAERAAWVPEVEALERFSALETEVEGLNTQIDEYDKRQRVLERASRNLNATTSGTYQPPNVNRNADPYDFDDLPFYSTPLDLRARAETAIEKDERSDSWALEAASATLRNVRDAGQVARLFLATGSEARS